MASDRDERPKKSWREIDAKRDRNASGGGGKRDERHGPTLGDRSSKQYRAALEAAFAKGEVGKLVEKMQRPKDMGPPMPKPAPAPTPAPVATSEAGGDATEKPKVVEPQSGKVQLKKKIVDAVDRDEISRAVDKYVKEFGLPEDFDVLEQALEHRKNERVTETLSLLERLLDREKPKRSRALIGRLRFLAETSYDDDIRAASERVRQKLERQGA